MGHRTDFRRRKRLSKQQEKSAAADLGGRTQANSGATRLGGGADVRVPGTVRVECKTTEKDAYVLKLRELEKVKEQALKCLEYPVLQFAFRYQFNKGQEKYAVTRWNMSDPFPTPRKEWRTENISMIVRHDELTQALHAGRLLVSFGGTVFEIRRWDDFLAQFEGKWADGVSMGCKTEKD